jgi:hypothetical protein
MPELERLAAEVKRLTAASDLWTDWGLRFVLVVAVVGLAAGAVQFVGARRARQLADAQGALAKGKEDQLQRDLKEKDRQIEELKLARAKIEAKLTARRITITQATALSARMAPLAKVLGGDARQSVAVFPVSTTFEVAALADDIAAVLQDAEWDVNRNAVTFGMSFAVSGVGLLTSSNPHALDVADALASALNEAGISTSIISEKRGGCEEMGKSTDDIKRDPWCSQISVFVGDHP